VLPPGLGSYRPVMATGGHGTAVRGRANIRPKLSLIMMTSFNHDQYSPSFVPAGGPECGILSIHVAGLPAFFV
jgi:hypothetical protein